MKYEYIERRKTYFPVRMMCRLLKVSKSGYYAWRSRPESDHAKIDRHLLPKIHRIHEASFGTYGSPRVKAELNDEGVNIGRRRVARLMRSARLKGCPKRRFKVTTQRDPLHPVAKNLLKQKFDAKAPNQLWVSDICLLTFCEELTLERKRRLISSLDARR